MTCVALSSRWLSVIIQHKIRGSGGGGGGVFFLCTKLILPRSLKGSVKGKGKSKDKGKDKGKSQGIGFKFCSQADSRNCTILPR